MPSVISQKEEQLGGIQLHRSRYYEVTPSLYVRMSISLYVMKSATQSVSLVSINNHPTTSPTQNRLPMFFREFHKKRKSKNHTKMSVTLFDRFQVVAGISIRIIPFNIVDFSFITM